MERQRYNVDGLVNETIKTQMKNALDNIKGVNKVSVDIGRGSIEVMYNSPATTEQIMECIESTGHHIE